MSEKSLGAPKLLAALVLSCAALAGPSASAIDFVDTTPYGLVFASGTHVGQGAGSSINGGPWYYDWGTHNISIAFFRPPTGPATNPYSMAGFLPGSVKVTNSNGTVEVDVPSFTPQWAYWMNWSFWPNPYYTVNTLPSILMGGTITYKGASCQMYVYISPPGTGYNWGNTTLIQVQVNNLATNKVEFMTFGDLNGIAIVDP